MPALTGSPLTPIGEALKDNALANFLAKTFLVGYAAEAALTFGPMMADPASAIVALTHPNFDYNFINGAFGKGLVAAWAIVLSNPFEKGSSSVQTIDARNLPKPTATETLPKVDP